MAMKNKYNPLLKIGIQKISESKSTYYDATVGGSTADYPATSVANGLKAALDDGHKVVKIIDDISLFSDITQSNITIHILNGVTVTTGSYRFSGSGNTFEGIGGYYNRNGYSQAIINFNGLFINNHDAITNSTVDNITIDLRNIINSSTGAILTNDIVNNCVLLYPNAGNKYGVGANSILNNCRIHGSGGTHGCTRENVTMNEIYFTGTFSAASRFNAFPLKINGGYNDATNLDIQSEYVDSLKGNYVEAISGRWNNSNVSYDGHGTRSNLKITNSNVYVPDGFASASSATSWYFDNCNISGLPLRAVHPTSLTFVNCTLTGTTNTSYTVLMNNININNCTISSNMYIDGDGANITNNRMTSGTININATADKTTAINNRTLTSIVDNGTNTQLVANNLT